MAWTCSKGFAIVTAKPLTVVANTATISVILNKSTNPKLWVYNIWERVSPNTNTKEYNVSMVDCD